MSGPNTFRNFAYASFAVNLLLIGALAGPVLHHGFDGPRPHGGFSRGGPEGPGGRGGPGGPPGPMQIAAELSRDLPKDEAAKVQAIFSQLDHGKKDQGPQGFDKLAALLRQPEVDMGALQAELDRMSASLQEMHKGMATSIQQLAAQLSFESRVKVADRLLHKPDDDRRGGPRNKPPRGDVREDMRADDAPPPQEKGDPLPGEDEGPTVPPDAPR